MGSSSITPTVKEEEVLTNPMQSGGSMRLMAPQYRPQNPQNPQNQTTKKLNKFINLKI